MMQRRETEFHGILVSYSERTAKDSRGHMAEYLHLTDEETDVQAQ